MKTKLALTLLATLYCSGAALAAVAEEGACGENAPPYADLMDPGQAHGLNLDIVDERQTVCRKVEVGNDITTKILLLRGNKQKIEHAKNQAEGFSKGIVSIEKKLEAKKVKRKERKALEDEKKKYEQQMELAVQTMKGLNELSKTLGVEIAKTLGLTDKEVGKIPALPKKEGTT